MSAFNEGLMTGANLGQGAYRQRQAREVGGLMSGGNMTGARDALFAQGDVSGGLALDGRVVGMLLGREVGCGPRGGEALLAGVAPDVTRFHRIGRKS